MFVQIPVFTYGRTVLFSYIIRQFKIQYRLEIAFIGVFIVLLKIIKLFVLQDFPHYPDCRVHGRGDLYLTYCQGVCPELDHQVCQLRFRGDGDFLFLIADA